MATSCMQSFKQLQPVVTSFSNNLLTTSQTLVQTGTLDCVISDKSVGSFIECGEVVLRVYQSSLRLCVKLRVQRLSQECTEVHRDSMCQTESAEVVLRVYRSS